MQTHKKCELSRAFFHSLVGGIIIGLYATGLSRMTISYMLFPFTLIFGVFDRSRLTNKSFNKAFLENFVICRVIRSEEMINRMTSATSLLIGAQITLFLFSRPIAALCLLQLAWCDPIARIVGKKFGPKNIKKKNNQMVLIDGDGRLWNGKTVVGSFAASLLGFFIILAFLLITVDQSYSKISTIVFTSILGGLYGAIAEALTISNIDDNLSMPIISASLLTLLTPIETLISETHH